MAGGSEKYLKDLDKLIVEGGNLLISLEFRFYPEKSKLTEEEEKKLPDFNLGYQKWYSESLALLSQVLPERVEDFRAYYSPKIARKFIKFSNYTISDCLRGTTITSPMGDKIAAPSAAVPVMYQQYTIIAGLRERFTSTLYDIKTLVHADLLDDELDTATVLNRNGYARGAGAVAGVVLEGHLSAVCVRHAVTPKKKDPAISDLNDALKTAGTIEVSTWRFIQHLGDIRNKCDHKKSTEPTAVEVTELIDGVKKITKTVF